MLTRTMHSNGRGWVVAAGGALAAATLAFGLGGCATIGDGHGARLTDNLEVYAPFNNERAAGPGYLVGPPQQNLRDETQADDTRGIPRIGSYGNAADPSAPPLTSSAPTQTLSLP
jgi:hypothetical protein